MLRYNINILLVIGLLSIGSTSSAKIKDILPTGLQVGFDVTRPLYYIWYEKTGAQYEFNASLDLNRILLEGEYGLGTIARKNPPSKLQAISSNIGQYFRIGFNYNFISNSVDHNAAFLGLRYSQAYFKDELYGKLTQEKEKNTKEEEVKFWGDIYRDKVDETSKLKAHWFEIVAGVRVKVWKWIYIGCTARYKFAKKISTITSHNPFDIIGWGLNDEDVFGINYYISMRIPLQADKAKEDVRKVEENKLLY
ncbi:MAG: DUF6048 family protein [Candidatus Amoebophilus sp.]